MSGRAGELSNDLESLINQRRKTCPQIQPALEV